MDIADSALFAEMASSLAPILVPEVRADPRFAAGEFQPTQSWLGVPLVSKGRILGLLAIDKVEPHFYLPQSTPVLMAFASQAAVSLDNARLFEESEQGRQEIAERSQRLALLNRVSAQLSGTLHEDQILTIILSEIMGALAVQRALMVSLEGAAQSGGSDRSNPLESAMARASDTAIARMRTIDGSTVRWSMARIRWPRLNAPLVGTANASEAIPLELLNRARDQTR